MPYLGLSSLKEPFRLFAGLISIFPLIWLNIAIRAHLFLQELFVDSVSFRNPPANSVATRATVDSSYQLLSHRNVSPHILARYQELEGELLRQV